MGLLLASGARSVLDLGCGSGALLRRLAAHDRFTRIVGLDTSFQALSRAGRGLAADGHPAGERIALRHESLEDLDAAAGEFDAAVMVEAIEHMAPADLQLVERAVFTGGALPFVVVTTPNREYNARLGLAEGELRHADHRFEWTRAGFQRWAAGIAERRGYEAAFHDIGPSDAWLGTPSQAAVFRRRG